ncbi:unnamed protein product [Sphagnum balticum]
MEDNSQRVSPAKEGEIKITSSSTGAVRGEVCGATPVPVPRKLTARGVNRNNNPFLLRLQSHQVGVWKENRLSFACTIWIPSFWSHCVHVLPNTPTYLSVPELPWLPGTTEREDSSQGTPKLHVAIPLSAAMAICALHLELSYGEKSDGLVTQKDVKVPGAGEASGLQISAPEHLITEAATSFLEEGSNSTVSTKDSDGETYQDHNSPSSSDMPQCESDRVLREVLSSVVNSQTTQIRLRLLT